jgi:ferredoxin-NADP reductase
VFSLIKSALYTSSASITLLYSNRSVSDTIFYDELIALSEQFTGRFKLELLFSNSNKLFKKRLSKVVLTSLLEKYKTPIQKTLFYMCGPAEYMLMAGITLLTAGVPENNIRKENFNTRKHSLKPIPPDQDRHLIKLAVNNEVYEFPVQYPDTILSAAKKLRIDLPYSCEAGNCGSCAALCTTGKIWMAYNEVLMEEEIAKGIVLTCQAYVIEADAEIGFPK